MNIHEPQEQWLSVLPAMPGVEFDILMARWSVENQTVIQTLNLDSFTVDPIRASEGTTYRRLCMDLVTARERVRAWENQRTAAVPQTEPQRPTRHQLILIPDVRGTAFDALYKDWLNENAAVLEATNLEFVVDNLRVVGGRTHRRLYLYLDQLGDAPTDLKPAWRPGTLP